MDVAELLYDICCHIFGIMLLCQTDMESVVSPERFLEGPKMRTIPCPTLLDFGDVELQQVVQPSQQFLPR